jgi:sugar lactone lactonase YvrE
MTIDLFGSLTARNHMNIPITRNRWALSSVFVAIVVAMTIFTSASWGDHASAATIGTVPVYEFQWGSSGTGNRQFDGIYEIAIDSSGDLYIADPGNTRIQKIVFDGTYISQFGSSGTADGQFLEPTGIAFDDDGNIYVVDASRNNIQKFTSSGTFITTWNSSESLLFSQPYSVALDSSDNVYIADSNNHRVVKSTKFSSFILNFGTGVSGTADGQLDYPTGVAVGPDGSVYIVENQNNRVSKFSSDGSFVTKWGTNGIGDGQFSDPWSIAVDILGNVYVTDGVRDDVQKFDSNGTFITKFGSTGTGNGQFNRPTGVAVTLEGYIWVGDYQNENVQMFSQQWIPDAPTGITASAAGPGQATVSWTAPVGNGGTAITQYTVTTEPFGPTVNTTGTSVDVPGLTNGITYFFRVAATNSVGSGPVSSVSNSVTPVSAESGLVLTDLLTTASSLNLLANQVSILSASPRNELGEENLSMPSVVYSWSASGCGTLTNETTRTPTFTTSGNACSATISVHASQGGGSQVPATDRSYTVNVAAPPVPIVIVPPVDPVVIPSIIPDGLNSEDVALILPTSGGRFTVPQAAGVTSPAISLDVPAGALDNGTAAAVTIKVVSTGNLAAPPPAATEGATSGTFSFGSTVIEVQWYDDDGNPLDTKTLNKPAKICVPFVKADVDAAAGGPDGLAVWRYNGTVWVKLNSSVNVSDGTVCAYTSRFSVFALGLDVAPPEASEEPSGLPATGGYTPNALTLLMTMLAGAGLIVTGVVVMRRTRAARPTL